MSAPNIFVAQTLIPAQIPVFSSDLSSYQDALAQAWEALAELRAADPTPMQSNVKASYVSPWHSHRQNPKFGPLCEVVVNIARYASKEYLLSDFESLNLDYYVKDCWAMVYEESDHTLRHNHFPADISAVIYLEAAPGCAPIVFDSKIAIQPTNNLLVLFPGVLNHEVPATPGRRVVIAMNLFKYAVHPK